MKNTLSKFASSFAALLSDSTPTDTAHRLEEIRNAMLGALMLHIAPDAELPPVWQAIARATTVQTLWYLRSDVLGFLSEHGGEPSAREALHRISEHFRGLVPDAQMPRRSPLGKSF